MKTPHNGRFRGTMPKEARYQCVDRCFLASQTHKLKESLDILRLLGILYLVTCCSAYATEEIVLAGGGPLEGILGLLILPWIRGVPTALGLAFNGGVLIWNQLRFWQFDYLYHGSVQYVHVCH